MKSGRACNVLKTTNSSAVSELFMSSNLTGFPFELGVLTIFKKINIEDF